MRSGSLRRHPVLQIAHPELISETPRAEELLDHSEGITGTFRGPVHSRTFEMNIFRFLGEVSCSNWDNQMIFS
jgi:hypothetical protein